MTFWSLTNSDFPTNQTFHQFHDLYTVLDLHRLWVVSMEHLQRVWHASRERLPFRTPGSVPHCGTCLCSNCWDQISQTCHVFTRLFTSNTPWYSRFSFPDDFFFKLILFSWTINILIFQFVKLFASTGIYIKNSLILKYVYHIVYTIILLS